MLDSFRYIWLKRSVNIQYCQTHIAAIYHWLVSLIWINAGFIPADRWNDAQAYAVSHRFHHSLCSYFTWSSELKRCCAVHIHCQMSVNIFCCRLSFPKVVPCHYSSVYRRAVSIWSPPEYTVVWSRALTHSFPPKTLNPSGTDFDMSLYLFVVFCLVLPG